MSVSRKVSVRCGYVLIEPESDATSQTCDCTGAMEIVEQIAVQCNEEKLTILEPILITVRSFDWSPGGNNYFIYMMARYEPDASDTLHIWITPDLMEDAKDSAFYSRVPQLVMNYAVHAIQADSLMCGGYLCFCRVMTHPLGNPKWAFESAVQGIIGIIRSNYSRLSDKQIRAMFKYF